MFLNRSSFVIFLFQSFNSMKKTSNYLLVSYHIIFQCSFMNVGFEIIMQWLQSMKRKTCKLSMNKLCCYKVCDDHCCVHKAISIKCRN